jgi:hypothetical protein
MAGPVFTVLNQRLYPPFPATVEWEGRPIPEGYGAASRRLRRFVPDEQAMLAPDLAAEAFLYHVRLGLHYGYPLCCVLQYASEAPYLPPFQVRPRLDGNHIPCDGCLALPAPEAGGPDPAAVAA